MRSTRARSGTQSIQRAFAVLKEVCAVNATGVTLPVLVKKLRLNRTTTYRILQCLVGQGAVRCDTRSRRYFLGPLTFELGIAATQQLDLKALIAPALARIAEITGDTVFLMLKSGNDSVCIDRRMGSYPIKTLVVEVGTRRPLGIGAGSLAMLSALPEDEIERVMQENASRYLAYGKTPEALIRAVRTAQKARHVSTPVYGLMGVTAVALPVRDAAGRPVAALSVAAIAKRMSKSRQQELVRVLRSEAAHLERMLRDTNVVDQ